jgi:phage terminase small subunit
LTTPKKKPKSALEAARACKSTKLSPKEQLFVEEYLKDLHQGNAYLRAGYRAKRSSASTGAHILMCKPKIKAAIEAAKAERSRRNEITADRILQEMARLAFLDIGKAFDEGGNLKPLHEMDEDTRRAISGLEVTALYEDGENVGKVSKIKLADKRAALVDLAKHSGHFDQKVTVESDGDAISLLVQSVQGSAFTPIKVIEHETN